MHYTQLFRSLREAKGLTLEELSRQARRHRNTVVNVESGRPVKFKTIEELMLKMGYAPNSSEMRSIALLWLEAISGLPFSRAETENSARKSIATYRSTARQAAKRLEETISRAGLTVEQIGLLAFAVQHPEALSILDKVRELASTLATDGATAELKVAEDR
ncbi:MAG: transcriptional regulator, family [Verrucomicrobia bacterium]|nr:transcriptional regulator, family [Verrucomicrobiota bacterium]